MGALAYCTKRVDGNVRRTDSRQESINRAAAVYRTHYSYIYITRARTHTHAHKTVIIITLCSTTRRLAGVYPEGVMFLFKIRLFFFLLSDVIFFRSQKHTKRQSLVSTEI